MPRVIRVVTLVDVVDGTQPRSTSFSARHEAVLDDGGRVLLLDDRGWSETLGGAAAGLELLPLLSRDDIAETARMVVGPDEAFEGHSQDDMDTDHWNSLAEKLRATGVNADAGDLRRLPHDVVLSEALLALLGRRSDNST
jgi:hypothetical protein